MHTKSITYFLIHIKWFLVCCCLWLCNNAFTQSQKIIGTLKASNKNSITITPYSVDSSLLQQAQSVQQKAIEDMFPPINATLPQNNTLKGRKLQTGSIVAEKKKPIVFQPDSTVQIIPETQQITDTVAKSNNINTPISSSNTANTNNTPVSKPISSNTTNNSTTTNNSNIPQNKEVVTVATNNNTNSTNYYFQVNTSGYTVTFNCNGSMCTVSSFGRIIGFTTGSNTAPFYNTKGLLEGIGNLKIDYTYEGRVLAINGLLFQYNFNGNVQQVATTPIVYTNNKLASIGNSKIYYDVNGNISGADATTNISFNK